MIAAASNLVEATAAKPRRPSMPCSALVTFFFASNADVKPLRSDAGVQRLGHAAKGFAYATSVRGRRAQCPNHLLLVEFEQTPCRRRRAKHTRRRRDMPACVIVIGKNRIADAALRFHAQNKRMQKITPADFRMLRQGKNRR